MIYTNNEMENAWMKENFNTSTTQWIIIVAVIASKKCLWGCYILTLNKNWRLYYSVETNKNIARRWCIWVAV